MIVKPSGNPMAGKGGVNEGIASSPKKTFQNQIQSGGSENHQGPKTQKQHLVEDVARFMLVGITDVERVKKNAETLYEIRTRSGNPRLPLVPPSNKITRGQRRLGKHFHSAEEIKANSSLTRKALAMFLKGDPSHGMETILGNKTDALVFIDFLTMLSIAKSRLIVRYYPDIRADASEINEG
jgi:hypothetical protein